MKNNDYVNNLMSDVFLTDKQKDVLEKKFADYYPELSQTSPVANPITGESLSIASPNAETIDFTNSHYVSEDEKIDIDTQIRQSAVYPGGDVYKTLDTIRQTESPEVYSYAVDSARHDGFVTNEGLKDYYNAQKYGGQFQDNYRIHDELLDVSGNSDSLSESSSKILSTGTGVVSTISGISSVISNHMSDGDSSELQTQEESNNSILNNSSKILSTGTGVVSTISDISSVISNYMSSDDFDFAKIMIKRLYENISTVKSSVEKIINNDNIVVLFAETRSRIGSVSNLFCEVNNNMSSVLEKLSDAIDLIDKRKNDAYDADVRAGEEYGGYEGVRYAYAGDDTDDSTENHDLDSEQPIENIETEEQQTTEDIDKLKIENEKLINISLGALAFQTPITLFLSIGGEQIQSSSETEYGILGIENIDGVLYYKIIDKKTGNVYYAKLEDIKIDEENDLKVLHTKDNALVLNSTDIGAEDNFVKLAIAGSYFMIKDNQEINGVNFATVLDSSDGNNYYVPISENVEVLSLSQLGNEMVTETVDSTTNTNTDDTNLDIEVLDETLESPNNSSSENDTIYYSDSDVDISETDESNSIDTSSNDVDTSDSFDKVPDINDDEFEEYNDFEYEEGDG